MGKTILITGGQRSGKSEFAERLAMAISDRPVYIATARVYDEEFRQRVEAHKARRGPCWISVEEPLYPSRYSHIGTTVLVDCVTLWVTRYVAEKSDEVYLLISGIDIKIKG